MQPAVDPVDAVVREPQEERRAGDHVRDRFPAAVGAKRALSDRVVHHAVAADVSDEPGEGEEVEEGEGLEGEHDLLVDLVLEEAGVEFHALVEDEVVGEGADGEVEEEDADVGDDVEGEGLAEEGVAGEGGGGWEGGEEGEERGRRYGGGGEVGDGEGGGWCEGVFEGRVERIADVLVKVVQGDVCLRAQREKKR